jgi:hypothetical protein
MVVKSSLVFQKNFFSKCPTWLVLLAQVGNEIIGHLLPITEILHLVFDDVMMHHEEALALEEALYHRSPDPRT